MIRAIDESEGSKYKPGEDYVYNPDFITFAKSQPLDVGKMIEDLKRVISTLKEAGFDKQIEVLVTNREAGDKIKKYIEEMYGECDAWPESNLLPVYLFGIQIEIYETMEEVYDRVKELDKQGKRVGVIMP